jgi:hypothetical protein
MTKRIHHMGLTLAQSDHDRFHRNAPDLTPHQHEILMKRMGISKEQDEAWHRTHLTLGEQRTQGLTHIEPSAISSGFIQWCVNQGWLIQRGSEFFATKQGIRKFESEFETVIARAKRR